MIFNYESIGCNFIFLQSTTREFEGAVASTAMKVVMMALACSFEQSPEGWMNDPFQPPVIDQELEVPIDCCLIKRLYELATVRKNFIHPQRPVVLSKDLFYCYSLCRVSPQSLNLLFCQV